MTLVSDWQFSATQLHIDWADGRKSTFSALWLRDHCQMPSSRDPVSGQRLINITDIDPATHIINAQFIDDKFQLGFLPQAHESIFAPQWLLDNTCFSNSDTNQRSSEKKILWTKQNICNQFPTVNYELFCTSTEKKKTALQQVRDLGFVLIDSVPCKSGTVLDVIREFGFVRETNYGPLFEVRTEVDAINLAFTNLGLGCHLDNPYRDPVPGLQLLHCLSSSTNGGESILQDGFMAAQILFEENPEHFSILNNQWIEYQFKNATTLLKARVPMIETNDLGQVIKVRYNNRSIAPLRMPEAQLSEFYPAYRQFAEILERTELQIQFKLSPGQLILFDNTRILHARTAYSGTGTRHLQGAYSDLDGLYSTLMRLE